MCAERHANADLMGATCNCVRFHAIHADDRQEQRDSAEDTKESKKTASKKTK